MCGICGIIHREKEHPVARADVIKMCNVIKHRGPDDEGQFVCDNVGIGMRRLSIIDLSTGHQPIFNEDRSMAIVFNGEIYNHVDIRRELTAKGHVFVTKTDTEAILHAYEEWGINCLERLNGMFAFAIWDGRRKGLFLARDRIGIKPLYYYCDAQQLVFASELKSIVQLDSIPKEIEPKALDAFLTFEYIPSPYTIFTNIHKLPPGHWLSYRDGRLLVRQYWDVQYNCSTASEAALNERLDELLADAVKIRLMSDVPLGAFLSGGLDSSTIVAMMSRNNTGPVKSFSIGFDETTYNELPYARAVAERFRTEHFEEIIKPDAADLTEKIVWMLDEPFGDFSVFPTYLVSQMARKNVTVVLSGDGGDELLAGYDTYIAQRLAKKYARLPGFLRKLSIDPIIDALPPTEKKKGLINRAKRFIEGARLPGNLQHVRWMIFMQKAEKDLLYSPEFSRSLHGYNSFGFIEEYFARVTSREPLDQQEYVDIKSYLVDDILVKVDRMSMANSLEARVPFLDFRFVEFAATIPSHLRLKGKRTKHILKTCMQNELPLSIIERGKEGFSIPIKNWIKNELKPMMLESLSEKNVKEKGYFDPQFVKRLVSEHLKSRENHSHRLWALMVFHLWYDLYMKHGTKT
ncbi:asparagine synthase (glutamine-hydrolyzing) [candidate division KSB1 bacterium]|nr:asparagine synthase (glutamine-hydrolyzing) [candidate division KSB1 bacterium]RQW10213.1 MAG: asparagine synthase (glutamine-hydrolyzing) [candidate division KSB1 bacterium]